MEPEQLVRRYLRVFETGELDIVRELVAEDVEIWGAGHHVIGREHVLASVASPGLSHCRMRIIELSGAADRVSVYFENTYRHDATGRDVTITGLKMYQVADDRIVRFWGETDLHGLLRQLEKVPPEFDFS